MKTYLLSFNTNDFVKSDKVWTSGVIDLYSNKYYTNFSFTRSRTGLNSLGDYTFTGTKIIEGATPTVDGSYAVTNYGELYTDPNISPHIFFNVNSTDNGNLVFDADQSGTPIFTADSTEDYIYRFIDTSSRIDIRTFKGAFSSSLNSIEPISFNLAIYESDSLERTLVTF
jgi:hypothetical protein